MTTSSRPFPVKMMNGVVFPDALSPLEERDAIYFRHLVIGDDDVISFRLERCECILGGRERVDSKRALTLKEEFASAPIRLVRHPHRGPGSYLSFCNPSRNAPHSFRHHNLKPCPFPGPPGFPDGDSGDIKDLPRKCQTKPRVLPEPPLEDPLLLISRDTFAIVLTNYDPVSIIFLQGEPDGCDRIAVPGCIIHQVVNDLDDQRVGVHLPCRQEDHFSR